MEEFRVAIYDKIVILFTIIVFLLVGVRAKPNTEPIGYQCYGQLNPLSSNQVAVDVVLDRLIDNTATRNYNYYTSARRGNGARCYGHALCRFGISAEDCMTCLIVTVTIVTSQCKFPGTASLVLTDCSIMWQFNRIEE